MAEQTTPGTPVTPDETGDRVPTSRRRIALITLGLSLGMFLAALDQTIVSTAIRTIADDLHGLTQQAWATTAYLVTSVVSTALYGKFSDLYGRRGAYLVSVLVFLLGSVLCATSQSMWQLATFRAVQGLGAGGLITLAFTVLADLLSLAESARYRGYFGAVFGISSIVGPVLGGFFAGMDSLLTITGWRWAFLANLPVGVAAVALVCLLYPKSRQPRVAQPVDRAGIAALVLCLVPLLIAAQQGDEWGWAAPATIAMFLLGGASLVLFVFVERRAGDTALLPPLLFRDHDFSLSSIVNVIVSMGVFGVLSVLPLYLQIVRGFTPTQAGLMILPQTLGIVLVGRFAGPRIARSERSRGSLLVGVTLMAATSFALGTLTTTTPLWIVGFATAIMGIGIGFAWQIMMTAIQRNAPTNYLGTATASFSFFREIGAMAGASVFLSLLFGLANGRIATAFSNALGDPAVREALLDPQVTANPANRPLLNALHNGTINLDDTTFLTYADERLVDPLLTGLASAMSTVFLVNSAILTVGAILVLFTGRRSAPKHGDR